jgi:hypothetical protein
MTRLPAASSFMFPEGLPNTPDKSTNVQETTSPSSGRIYLYSFTQEGFSTCNSVGNFDEGSSSYVLSLPSSISGSTTSKHISIASSAARDDSSYDSLLYDAPYLSKIARGPRVIAQSSSWGTFDSNYTLIAESVRSLSPNPDLSAACSSPSASSLQSSSVSIDSPFDINATVTPDSSPSKGVDWVRATARRPSRPERTLSLLIRRMESTWTQPYHFCTPTGGGISPHHVGDFGPTTVNPSSPVRHLSLITRQHPSSLVYPTMAYTAELETSKLDAKTAISNVVLEEPNCGRPSKLHDEAEKDSHLESDVLSNLSGARDCVGMMIGQLMLQSSSSSRSDITGAVSDEKSETEKKLGPEDTYPSIILEIIEELARSADDWQYDLLN